MNDMMPDPASVRAPEGAIAWSPAHGFVFDHHDRAMLQEQRAIVIDVDNRGALNAAGGIAPLVAIVRIERDVLGLYERLRDIVEHAADRLADG